MEAERVQRRLAAILAADVAGYSRLTAADEEGTIARLRVLRRELIDPAFAEHRGRIVKTTGDGILVEFASVVGAVRCAVQVQRAMAARNADVPQDQRIDFRIGIHLGDVVVEGDDLLGDGVNVAARLEGITEPGAICLSSDAYRQVKSKIDFALRDLGEQELKNIAEPIRVYALSFARPSAPATVVTAQAPRLSIVVLPFTNVGGDAAKDYFADGITEALTTDVSRIPGAFVIARNTAFTYKGKAVDARQIGRDLGVRYVLEGSVQSSDNRIRVAARLIDAETGSLLWGERFDKAQLNPFDMQDEITCMLARSLGIELIAAETVRAQRERPNNMDAVDLTMRARAVWNQPFSLERSRDARCLFESALKLDNDNVDALLGLADTHIAEVLGVVSDNPTEQMRLAEAAVSKVLGLIPDNSFAHHLRGAWLLASREPDRALRQFELAIALDCNRPSSHAFAGWTKILLGRAEEAEAHISTAIRLSPRDPLLGAWHMLMGAADLHLGRLDKAIVRLRRSADIRPGTPIVHFLLAAAFALAECGTEARDACATGRRLLPQFSISKYRASATSNNPLYLAARERIYDGMRRAGVPEE